MPNNNFIRCVAAAAAVSCLCPTPASAEMVLSKVIVDLRPGQPPSDDIEVWNSGPDRLYVVAEPSEIRAAGTEAQTRVAVTDPAKSGLVVSPQRTAIVERVRRQTGLRACHYDGAPSDRQVRGARDFDFFLPGDGHRRLSRLVLHGGAGGAARRGKQRQKVCGRASHQHAYNSDSTSDPIIPWHIKRFSSSILAHSTRS